MANMNSKDLQRWIGIRIYEERVGKKISQTTLADTAGVSRVFISQLENGNKAAKIDTYYRIACALNLSLCELFRVSGNEGLLKDVLLLLDDCSDGEIAAYTEILRALKKLIAQLS